MLNINSVQPYIPVGIAILASSLAYAYGIRSKKIERFYANVEGNLKDCCSPIFHEIRKIRMIDVPLEREKLFVSFFEKYSSEATQIYKLGSRFEIEWYYWMEESFNDFLKNRTLENWEIFWRKFESFYIMIEDEYWGNHYLLYREFTWLQSIWKGNSLVRLCKELASRVHEVVKFILIINLLLIYVELFDRFTTHTLFSSGSIFATFVLLGIVLSLFGLSLMISSGYQASTKLQAGKGRFRKFLEKKFPRVFIDKKISEERRLANRKGNIPVMFYKEQ